MPYLPNLNKLTIKTEKARRDFFFRNKEKCALKFNVKIAINSHGLVRKTQKLDVDYLIDSNRVWNAQRFSAEKYSSRSTMYMSFISTENKNKMKLFQSIIRRVLYTDAPVWRYWRQMNILVIPTNRTIFMP